MADTQDSAEELSATLGRALERIAELEAQIAEPEAARDQPPGRSGLDRETSRAAALRDSNVAQCERLEDEQVLLRHVAEQMTDSLIVTNLRYEIIFTNRSFRKMYGYGDELLGRSPALLNAEPLSAEIQQQIYEVVSAGGVWKGEVLNRRRDGTTLPVEVIVFPVRDDCGQVFAFAGSQRDMTERRQAEKEQLALEARLRHAEKLESLGIVAGGIAHDFNNLLVGIVGNADLALRQLPRSSPARACIRGIADAADRCAELIGQMLAYSGRGAFLTERVDLRALVLAMRDELLSILSGKTRLELSIPDEVPAIEADANQIRQVITTLVCNADEAIDEEAGTVSISVHTHSRHKECPCRHGVPRAHEGQEGLGVVLEVADTGCGMTDATRARIFDPFFTTKFTGRGLGLAAVHGILRGHQAGIEVESEPGKGAAFRIHLPVFEDVAVPAASGASAAERDDKSCTILLVDDEAIVRELGAHALHDLGHTVITATDGVEAVEVFRERHEEIACVLLDLTMPEMGGVHALSELRTIRPDLPVLVLSGFTMEDAARRFSDCLPSGFLQKPFKIGALQKSVSDLLQR